MKRILPALALAALTLTACGPAQPDTSTETATTNEGQRGTVFDRNLPDGRTVTCIWERGYNSGGLSCDWENAE